MPLKLVTIAALSLFTVAKSIANPGCPELAIREDASALNLPDISRLDQARGLKGKFEALRQFDQQTWVELMTFFGEKGDPDAVLANNLMPLVRNLPPELRLVLDQMVGSRYPESSSSNEIRFEGDKVTFPPKRALSAYMHLTTRPFETMQALRSQGKGAAELLDGYFGQLRERFFAGKAEFSYSGRQVLQTAKELQSILNEAIQREGNPSGEPYEVTMFGSFPGGRAKLDSSDIDIIATNPEIRNTLNPYYQQMRSKVGEIIPGAKLSLQYPTAPITPVQAATIGPVQVRITPERIELVVYPPFSVYRSGFSGLSNPKGPEPMVVVHTE